MSTTMQSRVTRYAVIAAIGATTLSVAACGSTTGGTPAAPSSSVQAAAPSPVPASTAPSTAPSAGRDRVAGLIASRAGSTIEVTQKGGTATVGYSGATRITEITAAALTDVSAGSCITVRPTRDSPAPGDTAITARAVMVSTADNGQCPPGRGGGDDRGVRGTVASVDGDTIVVNGTVSQQSVAVTDTTTYTKSAASNDEAIAQGECVTARGSNDGSGVLQATSITLRPAVNGDCRGFRQ
jgi:Domain of unknown function (DUF5666)